MNDYEKRISQLEDKVSRLEQMLSGKGKIVNFGKEFHVDATISLSEVLSLIKRLNEKVDILTEQVKGLL